MAKCTFFNYMYIKILTSKYFLITWSISLVTADCNVCRSISRDLLALARNSDIGLEWGWTGPGRLKRLCIAARVFIAICLVTGCFWNILQDEASHYNHLTATMEFHLIWHVLYNYYSILVSPVDNTRHWCHKSCFKFAPTISTFGR